MKQKVTPYRGYSTADRLCNYAMLVVLVMFAAFVAAGVVVSAARGIFAGEMPAPQVVSVVEIAEVATPTAPPQLMLPPVVVEVAAEPEPEMTLLGRYKVVGYNYLDAAQCGKAVADGITASGEPAVHGKTAAMVGVPFGTVLYIEGYGFVTINDRGVSGKMIDVAFDNDADCYAITGWYDVYVVEELK